ncbi:MAG: histidine kinase [Hespellia sp.]|nr:histidine kinase [Hespellia sp.]
MEMTKYSDKGPKKSLPFLIFPLYIWKKIRDSKIRTKLTVYLVLVAVIGSSVIGSISYISMKDALIDTAEDSAISLLKQLGTRMEERIREFQDTSYSFASMTAIYALLDDGDLAEMNKLEYSLNQAKLTSTFLGYTVLHNYSDSVMVESKGKELYYYSQSTAGEKMNRSMAEEKLELLRGRVTSTSPAGWVKEGNEVYFVRRITQQGTNGEIETIGTVIFTMSDSFFQLEEDENLYVSNQNLIICGTDGSIYKNNSLKMDEKQLNHYFSYKDSAYYIYATMQQINGANYLVVPMKTVRSQWNMLCVIPQTVILEKANQVVPKILVTTGILLALGLLLCFFIQRALQKNLKIIEQGMRQYETGNYSRLLSPAAYDEIGMLILQFNHMGLKINKLNELARREEEEKQDLQYQVMEAQINPHFLYNTLGSLKWLAYEKDQEEIAKLADAIINLLRFTVKNANQDISLKEELNYIEHYVYIQKMRYEDNFEVEMQITEDAMQFKMIGFVLQPFIENSILHGLDIAKKGGIIRITGAIDGGKLCLTVADNGFGMSEEKLFELKQKMEENKTEKYKGFNGIGVTNIIQRLKMVYGEEFKYHIESEPGKGTTVTLIIPERMPEDEKESIDRRG